MTYDDNREGPSKNRNHYDLIYVQSLIGMTEAGFHYALITTKDSAPCVGARQDDFIKEICFPGSLGLNPVVENSYIVVP